jgi:hypothetical protein
MVVVALLLGLILLVSIGILLTCSASRNDARKYIESIHGLLYESKQSLQLLSDRAITLSDNVDSIYHVATDIKFQQENLEKYEIDKAIKTLKGIELTLSDLKLLHDTLSSLERSLDIIVAHPAFTRYDDDPV